MLVQHCQKCKSRVAREWVRVSWQGWGGKEMVQVRAYCYPCIETDTRAERTRQPVEVTRK